MSRHSWYRNTQWSDHVADLFEAKLRRARRKGQYLRIQACTLRESNPSVALGLLARYFSQDDERFDDAQAHVDRAVALQTLGQIENAADSYEEALATESKRPTLQTQAFIELPYLIAMHEMRTRYARAFEILNTFRERVSFPVDHFKWNVAQATLADTNGDLFRAKECAEAALEAAGRTHSGLPYHPEIGLVSEEHADALIRMRRLCQLG
jgi:tetratricopeptide (TPR) repeat protein